MQDKDWNVITTKIKQQKCVLLLGPEVVVADTNGTFQSQLKSYLEKQHIENLIYYSEDEFFSFQDFNQEQDVYMAISEFYNQMGMPKVYNLLTEIPFYIIISLSPDLILKKAFEEKGIDIIFDFYYKKRNPQDLARPSMETPIVYNLLGSIQEEDSLVFTYESLFDYLIKIFGTHHLPDTLRKNLQEAQNFIFLGFKYERWYLKLLLRLLGLGINERKRIHSSKPEIEIRPTTQQYYSEELKVNFVDDNVADFVVKLHAKCQEEDLIRVPGEVSLREQLKAEVKSLLGESRLQDAINRIAAYVKANAKELINDFSVLTSRYFKLKTDMDLGLLEDKDAALDMRRIVKDFLEFTDRLFA
ncbi:MAG TPA: SIR2 family protein [Saprospiraceae bacterium]|nr:SIR2 family protein [Saprospiraceae bacterium]HMQ82229.1 SIR2 family protein [Saprospiraceae bacterium]